MRVKASVLHGGSAATGLRALAGLIAATLAAAPAAHAADAAPCEPGRPGVNVVIEGLRSQRGLATIELYRDNSEDFLSKAGRLVRVRRPIEPNMSVCLAAPAPGMYAVAVYHDENGDRKFGRNPLGLPTEGFGLSNNPGLRLGKPTFRSVRFSVGEAPVTITVRMRYLLGGLTR